MYKTIFLNYIFILDEHELQWLQSLHNHKWYLSVWFRNIQDQIILHHIHPYPGVWGQDRLPFPPSEEPQWPSRWHVLGGTFVEAAIYSIGVPDWANDAPCSWVAQRWPIPSKLFHGHWRSSSQREEELSHLEMWRCKLDHINEMMVFYASFVHIV